MFDWQTILDFWFGPAGAPDFGRPRRVWFARDAGFDAEIRRRFEPLPAAALAGRLDAWQAAPLSCLALLLALDQLPRNLYRGSPQAYAGDARAQAVARQAVERGHDQALLPVQRWFVYLPFEHAEDLPLQDLALRLFESLPRDADSAGAIDAARRHREIIQRFGRFPHRNAVLGRVSTPAEAAFLLQPGSRF